MTQRETVLALRRLLRLRVCVTLAIIGSVGITQPRRRIYTGSDQFDLHGGEPWGGRGILILA